MISLWFEEKVQGRYILLLQYIALNLCVLPNIYLTRYKPIVAYHVPKARPHNPSLRPILLIYPWKHGSNVVLLKSSHKTLTHHLPDWLFLQIHRRTGKSTHMYWGEQVFGGIKQCPSSFFSSLPFLRFLWVPESHMQMHILTFLPLGREMIP